MQEGTAVGLKHHGLKEFFETPPSRLRCLWSQVSIVRPHSSTRLVTRTLRKAVGQKGWARMTRRRVGGQLAVGGVLGPCSLAHRRVSVSCWGHPRATHGHRQGGHLPALRAGGHPALGSRLPALFTRARPLSRGPCLSGLCRVLPMGDALSQGPTAFRPALTPGP